MSVELDVVRPFLGTFAFRRELFANIMRPQQLCIAWVLCVGSVAGSSVLSPAANSVLLPVAWRVEQLQGNIGPSCLLGRDVEVRSNSMGNGLYASRDLEMGQVIGRYWGKTMSPSEFEKSSSTGLYAMALSQGLVVCGDDEKRSGFCRYINHSKRKQNCQAVEYESELAGIPLAAVYIETAKDVPAGSELFISCTHRPSLSPQSLLGQPCSNQFATRLPVLACLPQTGTITGTVCSPTIRVQPT